MGSPQAVGDRRMAMIRALGFGRDCALCSELEIRLEVHYSRNMRLQPLAITVVLFAGCATEPVAPAPRIVEKPITNNSAYINAVLPAWIGHRASELIAAWSKPTEAGQSTPGSYQGRGGIEFSYHIGDKGSVMTIPETSAYTDLGGTVHVYDSSTVIVPHFVEVEFVADTNGIIIHDSWIGTFTDTFDPARYPMPTTEVSLAFPVVANYAADNHGGNWSEPTAAQAAAQADRVTPDNILDKLNSR